MCCSREFSARQVWPEAVAAARSRWCSRDRGSARLCGLALTRLPDNPHHPLYAHDARDTLSDTRGTEASHACAHDALCVSRAAGIVSQERRQMLIDARRYSVISFLSYRYYRTYEYYYLCEVSGFTLGGGHWLGQPRCNLSCKARLRRTV
jgi:hypothetical protein